jgi:hypothetical protein
LGKLGGAQNDQQILHIVADNAADKPAILALDSVDDDGVITTYFLWIDQNGELRTSTSIPTNEDSDGDAISHD